MPSNDVTHGSADTFDDIARDLRALRAKSGSVSYAEIGQRIGRLRQSRGAPPLAAVPARTTVYDAFRDGRSRMNAALVGDIARALGESESEALALEARCGHAAAESSTPAAVSQVAVAAPPTARREPLHPASVRWQPATLLLLGCIALNLAGMMTASWFGFPLYLDMIGTAVAAFALGPWRAVLVAALTHVAVHLLAVTSAPPLPFVLVNVVGALVWGYGVHRLQLGASLIRFLSLNAIVGVVCAAVAVPIALTVFDQSTGQLFDDTASRLMQLGWPFDVAASASIAVSSTTDKLLTGFLALALVGAIRWRIPAPLPLGKSDDH